MTVARASAARHGTLRDSWRRLSRHVEPTHREEMP
jgi:hypothetical protein